MCSSPLPAMMYCVSSVASVCQPSRFPGSISYTIVEDAVAPCPPYTAKAPAQRTDSSSSAQTSARSSLSDATTISMERRLDCGYVYVKPTETLSVSSCHPTSCSRHPERFRGYTSASARNSAMCEGHAFARSVVWCRQLGLTRINHRRVLDYRSWGRIFGCYDRRARVGRPRSSAPFFDFFVADSWLACVSDAGFQDVQIIQQIFDFLANLRKLSSFLPHRAPDLPLNGLSHRFLSCLRFCGSQ